MITGTTNNMIREEALLKSWDLQKLRTERMKIESASKGGAEIAGDSLYKLRKYSYKNIKKTSPNHQVSDKTKKKLDCYFCGQTISNLKQHRDKCVGRKSPCSKCNKKGHIADVCRIIRRFDKHEVGTAFDKEAQTYNINLFHIKAMQQSKNPTLQSNIQQKKDFKVQVVVSNHLEYVIADTGARVSVCAVIKVQGIA